MALGGGTFLTQNKALPGSYINVASAAKATARLADRGVCALPLELDWGPEGEIFTVTAGDLQKDSRKIFGYDYTHAKLRGLRDLFRNANTAHLYRLNAGVKAANDVAEAKYGGVRGNDLKLVIAANVDEPEKFDVATVLDATVVDSQTVAAAGELRDNDFVRFKAGATLAATAAMPFTGGANGPAVTGGDYQAFLDRIEAYSFHILACTSTEKTVKDLLAAFTKRMRDQVGVKFQTVLYRPEGADYEGVIALENQAAEEEAALVYWVAGAQAGCAVNQSCTNKVYDGEYTVRTPHTQAQLEAGLEAGKFLLHKVGDTVRVLDDVNSLVTHTADKGADFSSNQTVRVTDQIANDIAALFNDKYLGKAPNDSDGRVALWSDIVSHHQQLQTIRAIEDFSPEGIAVEAGAAKRAVVVTDRVKPVNAMAQLYMTLMIS